MPYYTQVSKHIKSFVLFCRKYSKKVREEQTFCYVDCWSSTFNMFYFLYNHTQFLRRVKSFFIITKTKCYFSATNCFDFGLPGVLGIAFGGFLIGVILIGALWFIRIKTGMYLLLWFILFYCFVNRYLHSQATLQPQT